jgi:hypothetical protein
MNEGTNRMAQALVVTQIKGLRQSAGGVTLPALLRPDR